MRDRESQTDSPVVRRSYSLGPDFGATFVRGTLRKPLTWASCG
jgi:hypothetical protein